MWILSWKTYKNCGGATAVSIIGALLRYAGVMCFASMLIPGGLICVVLGIVFHFCAESIAKKKQAKIANKANNTNTAGTANANQKTNTVNTAKSTSAAQPRTAAQTTASTAQTPPPAQTGAQPSASAQRNTEPYGKIKCSRCGNLTDTTNKFCNECGNALAVEPPKPKKCLRCGKVLEADDKFCGQCGYQTK